MTLSCAPNPPGPGCGDVGNNLPSTAASLPGIDGDATPSSTTLTDTTCAGQIDWFQITVHETDLAIRNLQFEVRLTSTSGDSDLCLYSQSLQQLGCSAQIPPIQDVISRSIADGPGTLDTTTFLIRVAPFTPSDYTLEVRST